MDMAHDTLVWFAKSVGLFYLIGLSLMVLAYTFWPLNKKRLERELGDRFYAARVLVHLGEAHHAGGQHGEAALTEALSILDEEDRPCR